MVDWADKYVGMPYEDGVFDCTHLVGLVQQQEFDRQIPLPTDRSNTTFGLSAQIDLHKENYFKPLEEADAIDGDVIIMRCKGRLNHIGIFFRKGETKYVLHNIKNIGAVVIHKIRDLERYNIDLEGYYRFRPITEIEAKIQDK